VKIRRGAGNEELFRVLEGFPDLRFASTRCAFGLRLNGFQSSDECLGPLTHAHYRSDHPARMRTSCRCVPSRSVLRQGSAGAAIAAHLIRQLEELGRLDTRSAADLARQVADNRNNLVGK